MPKRRKKKPTTSAKILKAQKFNDFKKRLLIIAQACQATEAFKLIPKREIKMLFALRFRPFDIVAMEGQELSAAHYKILKHIAYQYLKNKKITFVEGGKEVSLYEYFYTADPLTSAIKDMANENFKGVEEITKAFQPLMNTFKAKDGPSHDLFEIAGAMSSLLSRFHRGYWVLHYHMISKISPVPDFRTCFKAEFVPPQILYVNIDGHKRPTFRVGYPEYGLTVKWMQLSPKQLNLESAFSNLKIDVYIQSHALHRLNERLDCLSIHIRQLFLFKNCKWCETAISHHGNQLIPFFLGEYKLGYLLYEYIEGIILIKTFLLLTNNATPEGEKLNQILGIEKNDKKYLTLDRLSHFIHSDIPENKALFKHFKEAGCGDLFNIDYKIFNNTDQNIHADLIEDYLQVEDVETETLVEEYD